MYSFPLETDESILMKGEANYSCGDTHLTGALYLTGHRLVFVGYVLTLDDKLMEEVLLSHIKDVKTEKTFYIFPNLIKVTTIDDKKISFVVKNRDEWFRKINQETGKLL